MPCGTDQDIACAAQHVGIQAALKAAAFCKQSCWVAGVIKVW